MNSINYVIVEVDSEYNNEKELSNGVKILVNLGINNIEYINRIATVISSPSFTILEKGDKVIIHHNILRFKTDMKGNSVMNQYFIEDNKYYVPLTEIFMYKRNDEWIALSPYCFIKPIKKDKILKIGNIHTTSKEDEDSHKGYIKNIGIVEFSNNELEKLGIKKGDKIIFSKNSEYEFIIDNELYYKMSVNDIMGKIIE